MRITRHQISEIVRRSLHERPITIDDIYDDFDAYTRERTDRPIVDHVFVQGDEITDDNVTSLAKGDLFQFDNGIKCVILSRDKITGTAVYAKLDPKPKRKTLTRQTASIWDFAEWGVTYAGKMDVNDLTSRLPPAKKGPGRSYSIYD